MRTPPSSTRSWLRGVACGLCLGAQALVPAWARAQDDGFQDDPASAPAPADAGEGGESFDAGGPVDDAGPGTEWEVGPASAVPGSDSGQPGGDAPSGGIDDEPLPGMPGGVVPPEDVLAPPPARARGEGAKNAPTAKPKAPKRKAPLRLGLGVIGAWESLTLKADGDAKGLTFGGPQGRFTLDGPWARIGRKHSLRWGWSLGGGYPVFERQGVSLVLPHFSTGPEIVASFRDVGERDSLVRLGVGALYRHGALKAKYTFGSAEEGMSSSARASVDVLGFTVGPFLALGATLDRGKSAVLLGGSFLWGQIFPKAEARDEGTTSLMVMGWTASLQYVQLVSL